MITITLIKNGQPDFFKGYSELHALIERVHFNLPIRIEVNLPVPSKAIYPFAQNETGLKIFNLRNNRNCTARMMSLCFFVIDVQNIQTMTYSTYCLSVIIDNLSFVLNLFTKTSFTLLSWQALLAPANRLPHQHKVLKKV